VHPPDLPAGSDAADVPVDPPVDRPVDRAVDRAEFVPLVDGARSIARDRRVRLGDVTASGRIRLDALARYLQDIAADDVDDAGVVGAWVLRRAALVFGDLPRYGDTVELTTYCSGLGSRWAERRTTLRVDGGAQVESVAIWVFVNDDGRPAPLEDWFFEKYALGAADRKVSGRLRHEPPPPDAARRPWPLRVADFDVLAHVNNAVSWAAVEDEISRTAKGRRLLRAEIEYRAPVDPGDAVDLRTVVGDDTLACWLTTGDDVKTSVRVELG
jgi:acyl-ACP thioesterase